MKTTKTPKKRGRPAGLHPLKGEHINVRCTEEQKALIDQAAEFAGLGTSTWLLQLGLQAARGQGLSGA